jgi:hypothetical protein
MLWDDCNESAAGTGAGGSEYRIQNKHTLAAGWSKPRLYETGVTDGPKTLLASMLEATPNNNEKAHLHCFQDESRRSGTLWHQGNLSAEHS